MEDKICKAFHESCNQGKADEVKELLLDPSVNINWRDADGRTGLFVACREGHAAVVDLLLQDGRINANLAMKNGVSPLLVAINKGRIDVQEMIIKWKREHNITPEHELEIVQKNLVKDVENPQRVMDAFGLLVLLLQNPTICPKIISSGLLERVGDILEIFSNFFGLEYLCGIDSARKELIRIKFFTQLLSFYLAQPTNYQTRTSVSFRYLLCKGDDIKEAIAQDIPDFLESLKKMSAKFTNGTAIGNVAGFILCLCGYFPNSQPILESTVKPWLFSSIQGEKGENEKAVAFDIMLEAAADNRCRPLILSMGVEELIQPYVLDLDSPMNFVACLNVALLSASSVDSQGPFGNKSTSRNAITKVLEVLKKFATSDAAYVETLRKYVVSPKTTLIAARSLSLNEENLKFLKEGNLISILLEFFQRRRENLLLTSMENLEEASNLVWSLSFDEKNREELIERGFIQILKSFDSIDHEGVKKAIAGALWNLEGKEKQAATKSQKQQNQNSSQHQKQVAGHIMISYSWAQKDRMRQLASHLKSEGLPIWLDIEQMQGSVLERMAEAIEDAAVVIIGVSSNYKESQACRVEAEYTFKLKKNVIYIMVEDGYMAKGWLGAMMGNSLWYNPWNSPGGFDSNVGEIIKHVSKYTSSATNPLPSSTAASSNSAPSKTPTPSPKIQSSEGIKIPENREALKLEEMTIDRIEQWTSEEVCRWLRMNHLEELLAPFISHKIGGTALLQWRSHLGRDPRGFLEFWKLLGIETTGTALDFERCLQRLSEQNSPIKNSRKELKGLGVEQLIQILREAELHLSNKVEQIMRDEEIDGEALLLLSQERLEGYGMPGGPTTKILNFISRLS